MRTARGCRRAPARYRRRIGDHRTGLSLSPSACLESCGSGGLVRMRCPIVQRLRRFFAGSRSGSAGAGVLSCPLCLTYAIEAPYNWLRSPRPDAAHSRISPSQLEGAYSSEGLLIANIPKGNRSPSAPRPNRRAERCSPSKGIATTFGLFRRGTGHSSSPVWNFRSR
jgi:hypothetical protein